MSKMTWTMLLCFIVCTGISFALTLAEYDAAKVSPAENPINQGWTEAGTGSGITVEGIDDGGTPAWRILDNGSTNPLYRVTLTAADLQNMYDYGWEYTIVVKAVLTGQFTGWGLTAASDPGWGLIDRERVGFGIDNIGGAFKVSPIHGSAITLGAGSASNFHTIRCVGAKQSSQYEFFLDGISRGNFDIKDGSSNSANDNLVGFMSGSSSGTGREAYWNYVELAHGDPLIYIIQSDDDTTVTEGIPAGDTYEVFVTGSPAETVTVTVTAPEQVLVNGQPQVDLVFTPPVDPGTPQVVTVTAIDDAVSEGTHYVYLSQTAASNIPAYTMALDDLLVRINDDDYTGSRVKVFLVGGQSNAAGSGANSEYPALYQTPQYDVEFWKGGRLPGDNVPDYAGPDRPADTAFGPLELGSGNNSSGTQSGCEMSLGRTLKDALPHENIVVIKYGMTGSALDRDHHATNVRGNWDSGPPAWTPSEGYAGVRYHVFMTSGVLPALQAITDRGDFYEIEAMFWIQGETDAASSTSAGRYDDNLNDLIASVRTELSAPDMKFVIGRLKSTINRTYIDTVIAAEEAVAEADENTYCVNTDDLAFNSDNLHYSAIGHVGMGERFANTYLSTLPRRGDLDLDGDIDFSDFARFAQQWLNTGCGLCSQADFTGDLGVDDADLAIITADWLAGSVPDFVARWTMDDGTGSVALDMSQNQYDGTLVNFPVDDSQWTGSKLGGALRLDGVNDNVQATGYQGITGSNARTVSAWINTITPAQTIISWGQHGVATARWKIFLSASGQLSLTIGGAGGTTTGATILTNGPWHHIAVVVPENALMSDVKLYVDGVEEAYTVTGSALIDTVADMDVSIGSYNAANYFQGQIDDVRIYSRQLDAAEIQQLADF